MPNIYTHTYTTYGAIGSFRMDMQDEERLCALDVCGFRWARRMNAEKKGVRLSGSFFSCVYVGPFGV